MSTNEHNEQSELQKKLDKVTPEQLHNITPGQLFATVAAVGYLAEQMQKDQAPDPLQDVEKQQAINLQPLPPLTILTSSQLDAKGKKLHGVALGDDPTLNPSSPDYNPQAYKDKLQELAPQITDAYYTLRQYQNGVLQTMLDVMQPAVLEGMLKSPEIIKELGKTLQTMKAAVIDMLADALGEDESRELLPYIMQALDSPKYADTSEDTTAEDWQQLIQEARQLREDAEKRAAGLPQLDGEKIKTAEWAISKISRELWDSTRGQIEGQYVLLVDTIPQLRDTATVVTINAEALPRELRALPEYDRRVWTAVISLWAAGCRCVTASNVYYAMGNDGRPAPKQLDRIDTAMYKMGLMKAKIDNMNEADRSNYALYWGGEFYILPNEKIWAINPANGQKVEAYLLPTDKPRLLHYAEARNQVRKIRREVLCTPTNQNDSGIKLDDYLIDRIIDRKDRRADSNKILYSSVFELLGTKSNHKQQIIDKIKRVLDYFVQIGFIDHWREAGKKESPGVYFYLQGESEKLPKK